MPKRTCCLDECQATTPSREAKYCYPHSPTRNRDVPLIERLMARVDKDELAGCWLWTGYVKYGYGVLRYRSKNLSAHRSIYLELVGPIPDDKVLDHACYNTRCVNPAHLRPVTTKQNVENFSEPVRKNNTSGHRGAHFHRTSGLWEAVVVHRRKKHRGGYYKTAAEAGAAAHALRLALHSHNELDRAA